MAATVNQSLLEVVGSLLYGVVAKLQQRAALVWHNTRQTIDKQSSKMRQTHASTHSVQRGGQGSGPAGRTHSAAAAAAAAAGS